MTHTRVAVFLFRTESVDCDPYKQTAAAAVTKTVAPTTSVVSDGMIEERNVEGMDDDVVDEDVVEEVEEVEEEDDDFA